MPLESDGTLCAKGFLSTTLTPPFYPAIYFKEDALDCLRVMGVLWRLTNSKRCLDQDLTFARKLFKNYKCTTPN